MLYPLKFKSIYKEKVWGGNKLKEILNKIDIPSDKTGESWEISGVEGSVSIVLNGTLAGEKITNLILKYKHELVGNKNFKKFGSEFPLLIKFIDASEDLSVQVHPNDEVAKDRHNCFGKTEMWYIIEADKNSGLISGVKRDLTKNEFQKYTNDKKLKEILNFVTVKKGDVFYIPSGQIHAIGKGVLLAEIQQSSDITYRIYDWDRPGADGEMRELHTKQALDIVNLKAESKKILNSDNIIDTVAELSTSEYFTVNRVILNDVFTPNYSQIDSFIILMCIKGGFSILHDGGITSLEKGETVLIPATLKNITYKTDIETEFLEVYI